MLGQARYCLQYPEHRHKQKPLVQLRTMFSHCGVNPPPTFVEDDLRGPFRGTALRLPTARPRLKRTHRENHPGCTRTMTVIDCTSSATDLKQIKAQASQTLVEFEEDALRNTLIRAAGDKLSMVAESSSDRIGEQIQAIRQSMADFDSIRQRMDVVKSNVMQIDQNVGTVVDEAVNSSEELGRVSDRMRTLEEQFTAIDGLVGTVSDIADQTHLLSLNATIEAARAGEAGRGFAIVADEVRKLADTTKKANREIRETLELITESVSTLSTSVDCSVEKMQRSISAVETTRESASKIGAETTCFDQQLQESLENFYQLDGSSTVVENEVKEINTIGKTFAYLLELLAMQDVAFDSINPLQRLLPLVQQSTFRAPQRFTRKEPTYELQADDILISATDTRGHISFANNCFYEIAEYEAGELVGQPHNVIRHPDMPKTAFADLWAVIKTGKLWQGYVANRSKHGRLYWVKANVFPCLENGKIVGYISIRTRPESDMVRKAIEAYRLVP